MSQEYVQKYPRPPITEAVIEFRFREQMPADAIKRIGDRCKKRFFYDETESGQVIQLNNQGIPNVGQSWRGRRLSSLDRADIVLVRPATLTISRLAPYMGWNYLEEIVADSWNNLRHFVKPAIVRIGTRFINRIDSPYLQPLPPALVNIYPQLPSLSVEPPRHSLVQITLRLDRDLQVTINSMPIESPVPSRFGWLLDIDVFQEVNLPQRDDEIWPIIGLMRSEKNRVFETLITDEARELFGK